MRTSTMIPLLAALPSALSAPTQPDFTNTTTLPVHFGLLVFPHFQALDVFGPMDVLNTLSMLYSNSTNMQLHVLSKTMDPVSTGMAGMHGASSFGESIMPTITFADYLAKGAAEDVDKDDDDEDMNHEDCDDGEDRHHVAKRKRQIHGQHPMPNVTATATPADIEVLIVPGGGGTRQNLTEEIAFVKAVYPKLKYIISVCTGATILARAGVLDGKHATTNKRSWTWATSTGPNTTWVPTARWVEDGNVWSSSGISAGIDVAYAWVSHVYGDPVSEYLSLSLEYDRQTDSHHDPYGKVWDVPGAT